MLLKDGGISVSGNISGTAGTETISNFATVTTTTVNTGALNATGNVDIDGNTAVSGNISGTAGTETISNFATVTTTTVNTEALNATGNVDIDGNTTVSGNISGTAGTETISNFATVTTTTVNTGALNASGNVDVDGNTTVSGDISGTAGTETISNFATVTTTTVNTSALAVSGNQIIVGNITGTAGTSVISGVDTVVTTSVDLVDTGKDHELTVTLNEDLTGDKTLNITVNDGDRSLAIEGNATIDQDTSSGSSPVLDGTNFTGIPDGALSANVALLNASQEFTGYTTFAEKVTVSTTSGVEFYNPGGGTLLLKSSSAGGSYTWTLPTGTGTSGNVIISEGTQTLSGTYTLDEAGGVAALDIQDGALFEIQAQGGGNWARLIYGTGGSTATLTIPSQSGASNFVMSEETATINGDKTLTGTTALTGNVNVGGNVSGLSGTEVISGFATVTTTNVNTATLDATGNITVGGNIVLDSSGKAGIGTTEPNRLLDIENSSGDANVSVVSGTSNTASVLLGDTDDDDAGIIKYNNSTDGMEIHANTVVAKRFFIQQLTDSGAATDVKALGDWLTNQIARVDIVANSNGQPACCSFHIRGTGNTSVEIYDSADSCSVTSTTASSFNLYYDGDIGKYEMENNLGATVTFSIEILGN